MNSEKSKKILILWASDNKDSAINMVFMYAENSKIKGWWDDVCLLIWGASSKLVSEDKVIQEHIKVLLKRGVRVIACKKCAENCGVVEQLERQNIEVFYTGQFLSDWLQSDHKVITI
jgi:hypothetical protein